MNGIHDMGGMDGFGPVEIEPDEPVFHQRWEARVFGMNLFFTSNVDAGRHTIECIAPAAIRKALDRRGLDRTGHLAYYLPIGSPLVQMREAAVATVAAYLEAFAVIGVQAVTVHANWPPSFFPVQAGVGWQIESLQAIL
ncbi:MAG: nitrile hydratase subunit beta, partial [Myxococcales bacterium]